MLESIKGIGPKTLNTLQKLGINTVSDLVDYYPYRYNSIEITPLKAGSVTVNAIVESSPVTTYIKRSLNKQTFRVEVENMLVNVVMFNRPYLKTSLKRGATVCVIGEYDKRHNTITASDIRLKEIDKSIIEPVYHLTSGITSRTLHSLILNALPKMDGIQDYIPEYLKEEYDFQDKENSLLQIHNPETLESIKGAIIRFKYEELFKFMFKINYLKKLEKKTIGLERTIDPKEVNTFIENLPFSLTKDQLSAIKDIVEDLKSEKRMNRLLLGDVGSGKTIVAVASIYYNYLSGYQSALLVPTEILAIQHYKNISKLLSPYGITVDILKGKMKKSDKDRIISDLKSGKIDLLICTHAVLEDNIVFKNLGLVITDEQHRFGVRARNTFQNKGTLSDVLYMSATPIPRTYALTIYGDMDISLIKTKPAGRKEIKTVLVGNKDIKKVLDDILEAVKLGHQVYIISPLIEQNDEMELKDVKTLEKKIDMAFKGMIPLDVLHGKLKSSEKDRIMSDFKEGKTKILISTTVIEVGVDVPNATLMVIFNAERFGLATLHQLRGRIGRSDLESKCILISDKSKDRLKVLVESNDGFYISEQDFKMRGEGDLFGTRQSGDMVFKIADLKSDMKILTQANIDSAKFIENNIDNNFEMYPHYVKIIEELNHID